MILSDEAIAGALAEGELEIKPLSPRQLNPASYDLTLASQLMVSNVAPGVARRYDQPVLDLRDVDREPPYLDMVTISERRAYLIQPGEFLLGCTTERVRLGTKIAARVEGKSSLARVGLAVHVTGGFIDPGFDGQITLEIVNLMHRPLTLYAGMRVAQIAFTPMAGKVSRPYADTGRYQGQTGPTPSRYRIDPPPPSGDLSVGS